MGLDDVERNFLIAAAFIVGVVACLMFGSRDGVEGRHDGVTVTLVAGSSTSTPGHRDGVGRDAGFFEIEGIDLAPNGDLLVQDVGLARVTRAGRVTMEPVRAEGLSFAGGVAFDSRQRMWMLGRVGSAASRVAVFRFDGQAGTERPVQWPPHDNTYAGFAVGADDTLYLSRWSRHEIVQVAADGQMRTLAGGPGRGYRDGPAAQALFSDPGALWLLPSGALQVCDEGNAAIRQVEPDGTTSTWARVADGGPFTDCRRGLDDHFYFTRFDQGTTHLYRIEPPGRAVFIVDIPRNLAGIAIDASGTIFAAMSHDAFHTPAGILRITGANEKR